MDNITPDGFPEKETFLDFEGREREFVFSLQNTGDAFFIMAREAGNEDGYLFQAGSETSPYRALGKIREKIRKRLATRYLQDDEYGLQLYHGAARGHIAYNGLVIDGKLIPFDRFNSMLETYEGWYFELKIKDLSDE